MAWQWEGDWHIETTLDGQPLDHDVCSCFTHTPNLTYNDFFSLFQFVKIGSRSTKGKFQGWTYAVDFPATYSTKKQWKSCVRRRKWVRYRRYSAMNSWCAIAPLHKDATKVERRKYFLIS